MYTLNASVVALLTGSGEMDAVEGVALAIRKVRGGEGPPVSHQLFEKRKAFTLTFLFLSKDIFTK